ncbi:MAG TPA: rRNA maturation RNase YbeY [Candidatus Baltobacteraceae bacterium]|nr:rRNA maturation RNase YbeY [Candidatus Baltobacteraceae bacterium]
MIYYRNGVKASGVNGRALVATAKKLLLAAGEPSSSLSLTLVNDGEIRRLNREHRGKDKPTDVLSFPIHASHEWVPKNSTGAPPSMAARPARAKPVGPPERLLGDVVISVDTARRQAAEYDASLQAELYRLLIHGILHVMGHDHERAGERRVMVAAERRLARAIALPWPYDGEN